MIVLFQYYFRCIETKEVPKKTRKIFPCLSKMLLFDLSALKVSMTRLFLSSQFRLKPKNKFAVPESPHFCISHLKRNIHYTRKGFFYHGKTANLCEIQLSLKTRHNRSSTKLLFSKAKDPLLSSIGRYRKKSALLIDNFLIYNKRSFF